MKHPALVPNAVTAFALACGLFAIFKMNMVAPGAVTYHDILTATAVLMLAAFLDLLDGAVARAMKVESEFGGVFDAMADAVSFGVAPSVVVLKSLSLAPQTLLSFCVTAAAMIYSISGVLRLVRFRVMSHMVQDERAKAEAKAYFTGLPIPAGAAVVLATTLLFASEEWKSWVDFGETTQAIIAAVVFVVIGYFMVSRWKFASLKTLHVRVASFEVVLATAVLAVIVLIGAIYYFAVLLAVVAWGYFLGSAALSLLRLATGKRLRSLDDFDPDQE